MRGRSLRFSLTEREVARRKTVAYRRTIPPPKGVPVAKSPRSLFRHRFVSRLGICETKSIPRNQKSLSQKVSKGRPSEKQATLLLRTLRLGTGWKRPKLQSFSRLLGPSNRFLAGLKLLPRRLRTKREKARRCDRLMHRRCRQQMTSKLVCSTFFFFFVFCYCSSPCI